MRRAPASIPARTHVAIGVGQTAPAPGRSAGAEAGEGRTALGLVPAMVRLVRGVPCRLTTRLRPMSVRHVSGDVEGRHEVTALAIPSKRLRGALAGATRSTRA